MCLRFVHLTYSVLPIYLAKLNARYVVTSKRKKTNSVVWHAFKFAGFKASRLQRVVNTVRGDAPKMHR